MHELLNRIFEELRNAWRFRWWALAIAWVAAIGGWLFVYSLPDQYEVQARVHIDTRSAIRSLVQDMAVTGNIDREVDFLIRTVLSRPNVEEIARRTGLDIHATTPEGKESLLDSLESRIRILHTARNINLYRISFTSHSAETARDVVQQVINIMTGMAVGDNGESSDQALSFLNREVDRYKKELNAIEREIAQFKKNNAELMPGREDYVTRLQALQGDIELLNDELSAAQNRRDLLEQGRAGGGATRVVPPAQTRQVQAVDAQIKQRRAKLNQLLTRYTEQHPDVSALRQEIDRLQAKRSDTVAEARRNPQRVSVSGENTGSIATQLTDAKVNIDTLKTQIERKKGRLDNLKAGAEDMSDTQARLAELNRNYEVTKGQYDKLLSRLYSARLSGDVQRSGNSMEFRVIDPPELPSKPTGPQRVLLLTMVLGASLAAGAAFAFFMSQVRPVFINRRALTDFTGFPVLGSISLAGGTRDRVRRQTAFALFVGGTATLILGYFGAVALVHVGTRFMPTLLGSAGL